MTTTDELREAVAREVRRAVLGPSWGEPSDIARTDGTAIADRIIRLVVDACIDEVPGGSICDPQDVVDFLRELAPKEPAP